MLRNEETRKMFMDLMADMADPKYRAEQEEYIRQLERQNALPESVDLVKPTPALAVELRSKRGTTVYANIGSSDRVGKLSFASGGRGGRTVSIPIVVSPPRYEHALGESERAKSSGAEGTVVTFDVVVHPETVQQAATNVPLRRVFLDLAVEHVAQAFKTFVTSKGGAAEEFSSSNARVVSGRKCFGDSMGYVNLGGSKKPPSSESPATATGTGTGTATAAAVTPKPPPAAASAAAAAAPREPWLPPSAPPPAAEAKSRTKVVVGRSRDGAGGAEAERKRPGDAVGDLEYAIKERGLYDLAAEWGDPALASVAASRPQELVVTIHLPEGTKMSQVSLDATESTLKLSLLERPELFVLLRRLPYPVFHERAQAKFSAKTHQLSVTLPVRPPPRPDTPHVVAAAPEAPSAPAATGERATAASADHQEASGATGPASVRAGTATPSAGEGREERATAPTSARSAHTRWVSADASAAAVTPAESASTLPPAQEPAPPAPEPGETTPAETHATPATPTSSSAAEAAARMWRPAVAWRDAEDRVVVLLQVPFVEESSVRWEVRGGLSVHFSARVEGGAVPGAQEAAKNALGEWDGLEWGPKDALAETGAVVSAALLALEPTPTPASDWSVQFAPFAHSLVWDDVQVSVADMNVLLSIRKSDPHQPWLALFAPSAPRAAPLPAPAPASASASAAPQAPPVPSAQPPPPPQPAAVVAASSLSRVTTSHMYELD